MDKTSYFPTRNNLFRQEDTCGDLLPHEYPAEPFPAFHAKKKHHPTFQARKNLRRDRATEVVYI